MGDHLLPYELTFEARPGYIYARVKADVIDRATALEYLTRVADRVSDSSFTRLMLERDIPQMLPDTDLFFTTQDFLRMIGSTRIAFVNPHSKIHDAMGFAMMIGTNRGANYQLFNDPSLAEEWLLA